jgi:hypothetical protein
LGPQEIIDEIINKPGGSVLMSRQRIQKKFDNLNAHLSKQIMDEKKFKHFYWAPDYSFCGFATSSHVAKTGNRWLRDKKMKLTDRSSEQEKNLVGQKVNLLNNVAHIP